MTATKSSDDLMCRPTASSLARRTHSLGFRRVGPRCREWALRHRAPVSVRVEGTEAGGRLSRNPSVDVPPSSRPPLVPVTSRPRSGSHDVWWMSDARAHGVLLAGRASSRGPTCAHGGSGGARRLPSPDTGRLHGSGVGLGGHVGDLAADRRAREHASGTRALGEHASPGGARLARRKATPRALLERLRRRTADDRRRGDRALTGPEPHRFGRAEGPDLRRQRGGGRPRRSRHDVRRRGIRSRAALERCDHRPLRERARGPDRTSQDRARPPSSRKAMRSPRRLFRARSRRCTGTSSRRSTSPPHPRAPPW